MKQPTYATRSRDEVRSWAEELPDSYILCRDMGHLWRPLTARYLPDVNAYEQTLRCGRCQTERTRHLGMDGSILAGHYNYPAGYEAPRGAGRVDSDGRSALRLTSVLRFLAHDEGK